MVRHCLGLVPEEKGRDNIAMDFAMHFLSTGTASRKLVLEAQFFRPQDQTVSTIGFPRSVWVLLETLVSAVHYTYMREYWVQGRKFPISTGMLIGASWCHR